MYRDFTHLCNLMLNFSSDSGTYYYCIICSELSLVDCTLLKVSIHNEPCTSLEYISIFKNWANCLDLFLIEDFKNNKVFFDKKNIYCDVCCCLKNCVWIVVWESLGTLDGSIFTVINTPPAVLYSGPNFIELLKQKKNICLVKSDYQLRLHSIVMLSKQQLNISQKQCTCHEIFASNKQAVFVLKQIFCLSSSMKLVPDCMGFSWISVLGFPLASQTKSSLFSLYWLVKWLSPLFWEP